MRVGSEIGGLEQFFSLLPTPSLPLKWQWVGSCWGRLRATVKAMMVSHFPCTSTLADLSKGRDGRNGGSEDRDSYKL